MKKLRCIHRHTVDEHPNCFARGLVKQEIKDDKEWEKLTGQPWYSYPGFKVGYLDIETDNLKADFGTLLTWALKDKGGTVYSDTITKNDLFRGKNVDREIVERLCDLMREYRIIVTYYGTGFDLPFIRSKAVHYGIDFPGYGEIFHHDIYYLIKSKFNLSRKSLDSVCDYFGIDGKTPIDKESWRQAKYGEPKALSTVLEHNIGDVLILERLHEKVEPYRKWIKTSI